MFTPYGFDEDLHVARNDYGDSDDTELYLAMADAPTRCIEHGEYDCAECDAEWTGAHETTQEPLRAEFRPLGRDSLRPSGTALRRMTNKENTQCHKTNF